MTDPTNGEPADQPETNPETTNEDGADAEQVATPGETASAEEGTGASGVPAPPAPPAPTAPTAELPTDAAGSSAPRGQRRITREVHTTTTRSETTTHETSSTVEDIVVAPPVYAAPGSEHPRPVG